MKQIRYGVFETNSSSTHSITMCSNDDYRKWERGEVFFLQDCWGSDSEFKSKDFVTVEELRDILAKNKYYDGDVSLVTDEDLYNVCRGADIDVYTAEDYWDDEYLEGYDSTYTTPSGEVVVAFGKYGYD